MMYATHMGAPARAYGRANRLSPIPATNCNAACDSGLFFRATVRAMSFDLGEAAGWPFLKRGLTSLAMTTTRVELPHMIILMLWIS